ncbi:hypothetical protein TWF102_002267 [Orbilia oligospora]|uniref:Uncharacterized protein n=1 Tax=Orbilia oligospora TaxID=2813651 RepID=A0A7C8NU15_ORBOL|nr:hypothetical protein TWF103_008755 [Orbilia oligospora]KAF3105338.1 hypothetical protein TWF102_002267 [Orbilia oligospora]
MGTAYSQPESIKKLSSEAMLAIVLAIILCPVVLILGTLLIRKCIRSCKCVGCRSHRHQKEIKKWSSGRTRDGIEREWRGDSALELGTVSCAGKGSSCDTATLERSRPPSYRSLED